jgi:hypothetical protein
VPRRFRATACVSARPPVLINTHVRVREPLQKELA